MLQTLAHVKWFVSPEPISEPAFNFLELVAVLSIVVIGLVIFKLIDSWLKNQKITKKLDKRLKPFQPWVPLIVRLSAALLLVINTVDGLLLAPNVVSVNSGVDNLIGGLYILAAILIALGLFTRFGAISLLIGYLLVFRQAAAVDVLDHFEYAGIAGYLWLRGPGRYSADYYLRHGKLAMSELRTYSLDIYRIGVGVGLAFLALSEKIFNVTIAQDFLNHYDWNILSFVGLSDRYFILIAGAIELLIGVALMLNYAPRVLVIILLGIMTATAIALGINEIYGHLFAVGIVTAVLVNDQNPARNS